MSNLSKVFWESLVGKHIEFTDEVENTESDFDVGMRGKVLEVRQNHDDVAEVIIDFSMYEDYNRERMKANYWDSVGNASLKWCETSMYPKNGRTHDYASWEITLYPPHFKVLDIDEKTQPVYLTKDEMQKVMDVLHVGMIPSAEKDTILDAFTKSQASFTKGF